MAINVSTTKDKTLKFSNGIQTEESIIGNIASFINEPVKHKCRQVLKYMQAFLLDLIRSIPRFEDFIEILVTQISILKTWLTLELQNPTLQEAHIRKLVCVNIVYNNDTTPALLV